MTTPPVNTRGAEFLLGISGRGHFTRVVTTCHWGNEARPGVTLLGEGSRSLCLVSPDFTL